METAPCAKTLPAYSLPIRRRAALVKSFLSQKLMPSLSHEESLKKLADARKISQDPAKDGFFFQFNWPDWKWDKKCRCYRVYRIKHLSKGFKGNMELLGEVPVEHNVFIDTCPNRPGERKYLVTTVRHDGKEMHHREIDQ